MGQKGEGMTNEELQALPFKDQNEFWRGGKGEIVGSRPHNCREYWTLKNYLESTDAPKEITETLEQYAYYVDSRLSFYANRLYYQKPAPPKLRSPR